MMPIVRINDATFSDLSTLKTWFGTKSPSETIDHIVREAMEKLGIEREEEVGDIEAESATTSVTYTKPLKATVNGTPVQNPNWGSILLAVIAQVRAKGLEGEKLVRELNVPSKTINFNEDGYRFHSELGMSMQGQSANDAWRETDRLAKKWRIPVRVEFIWRDNPKAKYPGKTGVVRSGDA